MAYSNFHRVMTARQKQRKRRTTVRLLYKSLISAGLIKMPSSAKSSSIRRLAAKPARSPSPGPVPIPPLYTDPVAASVRRLVPSVRSANGESAAAGQPRPNPSRGALEQLMKSPINWVSASKLTMDTERALRRRRIAKKAPDVKKSRNFQVSGISKKYPLRCNNKRTTGLWNIGNYCYRISVLQALLHLPIFLNWIERHGKTKSGDSSVDGHYPCRRKICLDCALRKLVQIYWASPQEKRELRAAQAHVDKVSNQLVRVLKIYPAFSPANVSDDAYSYLSWILRTFDDESKQRPQVSRDLDALFKINTQTIRRCPKCGHEHKSNAMDDFSIGVNMKVKVRSNRHSLPEYIAANFIDAVVASCDGCKARNQPMIITRTINSGPEALIVHMHRFSFNERGRQYKVRDAVSFDHWLDLTKHQTNSSAPLKYKLQSVVYHEGDLSDGHYIARVTDPDGHVVLANDYSVQVEKNKDGLLSPKYHGFTPYILIYMKVDDATTSSISR